MDINQSSYIKLNQDTTIYNDDCMKVLKELPDNSVDLVLTDPPYGTTSIEWDKLLNFDEVWTELKRIMKPKTNALFFGSQPFSSFVVTSNIDWFKYELIWNKNKCGSPGLSKYRPNKIHENILVFANESGAVYNPIMEEGEPYVRKSEKGYGSGKNTHGYGFGNKKSFGSKNDGTRYPKSILHASRNFSAQQTVHPTQKPTNLLNWLIMTYSNPGDIVLDFTMGSGSTGAMNVYRNTDKLGFLITILADILKGSIAMFVILKLLGTHEAISAFSSILVILGHIYPVTMKFKGGKGLGPFLGIMLIVNWRVSTLGLIMIPIASTIFKNFSKLFKKIQKCFMPTIAD